MKITTLIILLVSITATFFPCCEFDNCNDELSNTSHQEQKDQQGTCSPLSTCATCSGAIVTFKAIQITRPAIGKDGFVEIQVNSILPSYYSTFWQPPRMS